MSPNVFQPLCESGSVLHGHRNSHHFSGYRVLCGVPEHRVRAAEKEIEYDFHILVDALWCNRKGK